MTPAFFKMLAQRTRQGGQGRGSLRMTFAISMAIAGLQTPAHADVITTPPTGFIDAVEFGELELLRTYDAAPGQSCFLEEEISPGCQLQSMAAEWQPVGVPIAVSLHRLHSGFTLHIASLLRDRRSLPACWTSYVLSPADAANADRVWAFLKDRFEQWNASCSITAKLGAPPILEAFQSIDADMRRAYKIMRDVGGLPASDDEWGVDSFIPQETTQALLDAVALACQGPEGQASVQRDGTISWQYDKTVPYAGDGTMPFGTCVDNQIRYFPGYQAME